MRTGAVSYSGFDAMLYSFATVEFLRRWCGRVVPVGGGEYCDAKEPGLYAALEKAYKAMTIAAFTGRHPPTGEGMLEEGKTLSPVQLLIERDLAGGLGHFARQVEVTDELLGLEAILDVGVGLETNYLESEHTLRHFRQEIWQAKLANRDNPETWVEKGSRRYEEIVTQKARQILGTHQPEPLSEEVSKKLGDVVKQAEEVLANIRFTA